MRGRRDGRASVRTVLGGCLAAFLSFFVLGQLGIIPNLPARKVIAAHREAALSLGLRLEALHRAVSEAKAGTEPWDEDAVERITGVPVTAQNTAAIHLENLEDPTRNLKYPRALPVTVCDPYAVTSAVSLARTGRWPGDRRVTFESSSDRMEELFRESEQLRYLIVVRQGLYDPPRLSPGGGSFDSGAYRADAFLIEVPTGRVLGSFEFAASNDVLIQVALPKGEGITQEVLEDNLSSNASGAFQGRLQSLLPTAARGKEAW